MIRLNQASAKMQSIDEVAVIPALFRKISFLGILTLQVLLSIFEFFTCLILLTHSLFSIQDLANVETFDTVDSAHGNF